MNSDEELVLYLIRERLLKGRRDYGPLSVSTDKRNWLIEAVEEALDQTIYLAIKLIRIMRNEGVSRWKERGK